jgi:hypothetical protein
MCDVCYGTPGFYPIIDRKGRELYEIQCPECGGENISKYGHRIPDNRPAEVIIREDRDAWPY